MISLKILDNQFSHALSAGSPYGVIDLPFVWDRSFSRYQDEELIFITESCFDCADFIHSSKKILWILESPEMINQNFIEEVKNKHKSFFSILTHDDRLLHLPNSKIFPIGGCWIFPEDCKIYEKKTKTISSVISQKNFSSGHLFRKEILNEKKKLNVNIDIFGKDISYLPLKYKLYALKNYQYHICVENTRNSVYFTEKIIDCFATGTIPIYWGCSEIKNYFNEKGIITINSTDELNYCLQNINSFEINKEAIKENFELSKDFWLPENRILEIFGKNL